MLVYRELSSAERRGARSSPCSVELHLRGVALAECLPTARRNSHQELSSAERRGARSSPCTPAPTQMVMLTTTVERRARSPKVRAALRRLSVDHGVQKLELLSR